MVLFKTAMFVAGYTEPCYIQSYTCRICNLSHTSILFSHARLSFFHTISSHNISGKHFVNIFVLCVPRSVWILIYKTNLYMHQNVHTPGVSVSYMFWHVMGAIISESSQ